MEVKDLINEKKNDITLVAVSKTKPIEEIKKIYKEGIINFGENRVNELVEQGYDLPHTVTTLPEGTFEVKLHGDVDLEELDRLTNSAFAS